MKQILVFAGTTEGYELTEFLTSHGMRVHMCVATSYGSMRLKESKNLTISHSRMNQQEMEAFIGEKGFCQVIDATHPYAVEVTDNIRAACEQTKTEYVRVLRKSDDTPEGEDVVIVDSVKGAVDYLKGTTGNILVTTGSKELAKFMDLPDYEHRVYARVLSLPNVVRMCSDNGFCGAHLIAMQGPFSMELNIATMKQYDCKYLVTKEAGKNGGFEEKCQAARQAGGILVVIGRPRQEQGISVEECKQQLMAQHALSRKQDVALVGIGMGSKDTMTVEAVRACEEAQCIIGGKRLVDSVCREDQVACYEYQAEKIQAYMQEHPEYERIVVALSGDVGFYSGARKLVTLLGEDTRIICGISSLTYFMSKIGLSWEDAAIVSAHGKHCNLIHYIKHHEKTFAILGTKDAISVLAGKLLEYDLGHVTIHGGENLSYPEEKIFSGSPQELISYQGSALAVVCVENGNPMEKKIHFQDEEFIRGKAPMTKEEIRALSVDKLHLTADAICYDVGAGTGSVSMEMAQNAYDGRVYAIEKKVDAIDLIRQNKRQLKLDNLQVVEGCAPEALRDLETPTHAFVGGSSGNLKEILELLFWKNPSMRVVINCITLETISETLACVRQLEVKNVEIASVTVAKSKELGNYHMMMGENPIYIISFEGGSL